MVQTNGRGSVIYGDSGKIEENINSKKYVQWVKFSSLRITP